MIRLRSCVPRFLPEFYSRYSQSFSTMSRPPTPSSKAPQNQSEWRFHPISAATEWIEDYRPGGLHPIHIGDTLDGERYKILRKLGYGSFSTVWLARDVKSVSFR